MIEQRLSAWIRRVGKGRLDLPDDLFGVAHFIP
jgi:hypothetical protein